MNRRPPKSTLFPYPPPFRSQHGGPQMTGDATVFRATGSGRDDGIPGPPLLALRRRARPQAIYGAGLWVFIGVGTTLFSLFIMAYVMRMSGDDAVSIEMPRQLWLSTALLG